MWSHRMKAASFAVNLRRRDGDSVAAGSAEGSSLRRSPAAILDGGGLDLDITLEFLDERLAGEGHRLADELIRPVLAGGLDVDRVFAGRDRLAMVVRAVPD